MVTRANALNIIKVYKDAWEKRDPEKILTIFTKDATYHERSFEKPFRGHSGIREYWINKVCREQKDIKFKLLNLFIIKNTIIAEWEAKFHDVKRKERKHIREIVIIEIKNNKIKGLREYWHSKTV